MIRSDRQGWMKLMALTAAIALLGGACGGGDDAETPTATESEEPSEEPSEIASGEIAVTAVDFGFTGVPTEIAPGKTTFTLTNDGKEPHFFGLARLTDDAPPATELIKLPEKKANKFLEKELGGTPPIKPGKTADFTAKLTPGRYGYVCFVFSKKEKAPHALLGMVGEFTVS